MVVAVVVLKLIKNNPITITCKSDFQVTLENLVIKIKH